VETLEPAGVGALMALIAERKKKLAAEGLFDSARKQLLPFSAGRHRRHHLRRPARSSATSCIGCATVSRAT